jgi:hypothetical protein
VPAFRPTSGAPSNPGSGRSVRWSPPGPRREQTTLWQPQLSPTFDHTGMVVSPNFGRVRVLHGMPPGLFFAAPT